MSNSPSFKEIVGGEKPTVVDFFATWCGPCKMMTPVLQDFKKKMGDKVNIIKIDVDKNPALAQKLEVMSVPTIAVYQNGKIVWREAGVKTVDQLAKIVTPYLEKE